VAEHLNENTIDKNTAAKNADNTQDKKKEDNTTTNTTTKTKKDYNTNTQAPGP
jgi:hypothetical protein